MSEDMEELPSLEELAPDPFLQKLDRLSSLYREMGVALGVEKQVCQEERRASEEKDPLSYQEWEHLIYDEWEYDLEECESLRADFVLVFFAEAVRGLLSEARFELGRRGGGLIARVGKKRSAKKKRGDWLEPFRDFFSGSNIHLDQGPGWAGVQEAVTARDAVIHRSHLNGEGIRLTPEQFANTIERLRGFCTWLRAEVRARRQQGQRAE